MYSTQSRRRKVRATSNKLVKNPHENANSKGCRLTLESGGVSAANAIRVQGGEDTQYAVTLKGNLEIA